MVVRRPTSTDGIVPTPSSALPVELSPSTSTSDLFPKRVPSATQEPCIGPYYDPRVSQSREDELPHVLMTAPGHNERPHDKEEDPAGKGFPLTPQPSRSGPCVEKSHAELPAVPVLGLSGGDMDTPRSSLDSQRSTDFKGGDPHGNSASNDDAPLKQATPLDDESTLTSWPSAGSMLPNAEFPGCQSVAKTTDVIRTNNPFRRGNSIQRSSTNLRHTADFDVSGRQTKNNQDGGSNG